MKKKMTKKEWNERAERISEGLEKQKNQTEKASVVLTFAVPLCSKLSVFESLTYAMQLLTADPDHKSGVSQKAAERLAYSLGREAKCEVLSTDQNTGISAVRIQTDAYLDPKADIEDGIVLEKIYAAVPIKTRAADHIAQWLADNALIELELYDN